MDTLASRDPVRVTLAVGLVSGLIVTGFWVLQPFLPAAIWAVTIVIATWPLLLGLESMLWGRRGLAVAAMTLLLLLGFMVPLTLALVTIVTHAHDIAEWFQSLATSALPPPPDWLARVPFVGPHFARQWGEAAAAPAGEIGARLAPYTRPAVAWVVRTIGSLGVLAVQFLLVVLFSAILYASGESAANAARRFVRRLAGARGEHSARLAAQAIRGVALGIVVTALVQAGLAAAGLFLAGVPLPGILTALVFLLCVAQVGAGPVMFLAVLWTYWSGASGWGTALLVWSLVVVSIDNVVRPILIRKGADLPLLLVFVAVTGGLLAFGVVGIFVGPAVLAVGYSLLADWIATPEPAATSPRAGRRDATVLTNPVEVP